jgi:pSer/pThr/pTyr-binding forkhead associated (FHA) protein
MSLSNAWNRLNRTESSPHPLSHGDEIKIGDFLFKVEEENIEKYFNKFYS